ncbi:hypothetical protein HDE68_003103 [Pedobacter cryoconitis]|uniref:Uncharacterized protein n=1 Tax=Pedobacter cryoconitis TaxID=188932 RepID=A0A7W8ZNR8_9SPHI|nr:hypothetical protein [Pedobacter cryoconitis]
MILDKISGGNCKLNCQQLKSERDNFFQVETNKFPPGRSDIDNSS